MSVSKAPLESRISEGDVEDKLIYPLLTGDAPLGLQISQLLILSKHNLRRFTIGKGAARKSYFPDYLVVIGGFPLLVVEAKAPKSDLIAALSEARLYANELNAIFPHGINPVSRVMACDGPKLFVGYIDQAEPLHSLEHAEIDAYSEKWVEVQRFVGAKALNSEYERITKLIKPRALKKPRRLVGGSSIQQMEIDHNTFGATISADFAHIFNPISREDRARVAKDGYVASRRRDRFLEPIDRVVRASIPAQSADQLIQDTSEPKELIKPLRKGRQLERQVMLIVGGVGAGKTTFIDHIQEVALPSDVRAQTLWVHLDALAKI
jgi:hypothetical protein